MRTELADIPADILRVRRIRNTPAVHMKNIAELGGARLQTTTTALHLTGIKVLQNTVNRRSNRGDGVNNRDKSQRWIQRVEGG